jgi:hypothetical protein
VHRALPVSFNADVRSSSALAVLAGIRRVQAPRQALPVSRQAAGPCIPPAPRRPVRQVAVPALASVRVVARVVVQASASVPAVLRVLAAGWYLLRARHRVLNVRAVRRAAVDGSSTRRPRKAR